MTYKVTLSSNNLNLKINQKSNIKISPINYSNKNLSIKINLTDKLKVQTFSGGVLMPASFSDLIDYNPTGLSDKYVIMYDAVTQKYIPVNPDVILSASSSTEITQPGLPNDFINTLDTNLSNKIDLDAGSF